MPSENLKFTVTGMGCAACQRKVQRTCEALPGVSEVNVSLLLNAMTLTLDSSAGTTPETIIAAIVDEGFGAALVHESAAEETAATSSVAETAISPAEAARHDMDELWRRLKLSLWFLVPLVILAMPRLFCIALPRVLAGRGGAVVQQLLAIAIMVINGNTLRAGVAGLRRRAPDMSTLATLGSFCALFYSIFRIKTGGGWFFDAAGMILTIFTLGQYLESRAKAKTCGALTALLNLTPRQATVLRNGAETKVPIVQVAVGETVVVHPGEAIPVDGTVIAGRAFVDQSALTGEPLPVERQSGEKVCAATLDTDGVLQIRAEAVGESTTLAEVIRMVSAASASRAPIARVADRVCGWFVPAVIGVAVLTCIGWLVLGGVSFGVALSHAIAVLVISCPCAMGLATPVAVMVGTGRAAQLGMLFKDAGTMQRLAEISAVVIDKTGTITVGSPSLSAIHPMEGHSELEALAVAAVLEAPSRHPISKAFAAAAKERFGETWSPVDVNDFVQMPGRGITAKLSNVRWLVGNAALMRENGFQVQEEIDVPPGSAVLYAADEGGVVASYILTDQLRQDSADAIRSLKAAGFRIAMLTGDAEAPARAIAAQCGLEEGRDVIRAGLFPQDKARMVSELQREFSAVAMVGDGVNDAPALAAADVGIAIGSGTQVAADAASVVLMNSSLRDVCTAMNLSRAVMRNIRQNLAWAFGYNILCIPLAAGLTVPFTGWHFSPMLGAAAMACSSLCVTLNALRLKNFKS